MAEFNPEIWFHRRASLYVESQVLFHLNQCGVFAVLGRGGVHSSEELARELGLEAKVLRACLEYVSSMDEILEQHGEEGFALTSAGAAVLARFGRDTPEGLAINLFDVRVGGYEPVWQALGGLLRGELRYGKDVQRAGAMAAEGVFKIGKRMAPGLADVLKGLEVQTEVELGVTTGLSQSMAALGVERVRVGVDRSKQALNDAAARSVGAAISWVHGDFVSNPDTLKSPEIRGPVAFYSVHLHEFLALGEERVSRWLSTLSRDFPGSYLVALEQPAIEGEAESEVLRLYSSSNRFIHHLIGNGRILSSEGWNRLFADAGVRVSAVQELGYLGYCAWVVRLGEDK